MHKLYLGDCLQEYKNIEPQSVDLILTDLPYGKMKGIGKNLASNTYRNCDWDIMINPAEIFNICQKLLKMNGKAIFFSVQPLTTKLLERQGEGIVYLYNMYWLKDQAGNFLFSKTAPLHFIEEILVFKKIYDRDDGNPLREYAEKCFYYINKGKKEINKILGHGKAQHFISEWDGLQFRLCNEKIYQELIDVFHIDKWNGFKPYPELLEINKTWKNHKPSVFNLWEVKQSKSNVLTYAKDKEKYHPTQKPVALLEDLIKTFSNKGDTVLDLTMGSGSTGVAAKNCGRRFIGIEMNKDFFNMAKERIEKACGELANV